MRVKNRSYAVFDNYNIPEAMSPIIIVDQSK